jgi:surface antigen
MWLGAVSLLLTAVLLTGCGSKTATGGLVGGAGGGLLAYAAGGGTAGIVAGMLLGGLAGGAIGNALDQRDKKLAMRAAQQSLESQRSGESSEWRNPETGHSGSVTPTRTYQREDGVYCREYRQTVMIGEETHEAFGTACRQPDGNWKVVS